MGVKVQILSRVQKQPNGGMVDSQYLGYCTERCVVSSTT
jgi:hypothetical protein